MEYSFTYAIDQFHVGSLSAASISAVMAPCSDAGIDRHKDRVRVRDKDIERQTPSIEAHENCMVCHFTLACKIEFDTPGTHSARTLARSLSLSLTHTHSHTHTVNYLPWI